MAQSSCLWMLVLGSCVSLGLGADCRKECALCVQRLQGRESAFSALTCSLECEGILDQQKLSVCQDFLSEEENSLAGDADPRRQQEQEAAGAMMSSEAATSSERQVVEKYGGFMKRYGGFMSRRSSALPETRNDVRNQDEEENIRLRILDIISSAGGSDSKAEKRGDVALGNLLDEVLGRGLKKRYGGFMRRVGRPEWLVNGSKTGGPLKRAWENGNVVEKRYGGFMD
ncbi:proenkephalin-A [Austrofundulus limnaeus]|uniref:Proenkephalin-A n=1 Tax=Austrofundulus limnaeus TaxID=52670 RepID=A0A2I4AJS0_AUSLI|nr:PREDICTED: proenkephalin-A [Austrofundulus limnaeus]